MILVNFAITSITQKKLDKLKRKHNDFLDRYYEYRQTELQDGPSITLFPKHVINASKAEEQLRSGRSKAEEESLTETEDSDQVQEVPSPRSRLIVEKMQNMLIHISQSEKRLGQDQKTIGQKREADRIQRGLNSNRKKDSDKKVRQRQSQLSKNVAQHLDMVSPTSGETDEFFVDVVLYKETKKKDKKKKKQA